MFTSIIWNIRGINKPTARAYLPSLIKRYQPSILVILEHKSNPSKLKQLADKLGFMAFVENSMINKHIWIMWHPSIVSLTNFIPHEQSIHCCITDISSNKSCMGSFVYGRWSRHARQRLWSFLLDQTPSHFPWIIAGDFNVVASRQDKKGGDQLQHDGSIRDFNEFMISAGVSDCGFKGNPFTWSNNQQGVRRVWVRLDRALVNGSFMAQFPGVSVTHLDRSISDHAPLLLQLDPIQKPTYKFTYLRMWKSHATFQGTVARIWADKISCNPIQNFLQKLKKTASSLTAWNRAIFGNVDRDIRQTESYITTLETTLQDGWTETTAEELVRNVTNQIGAQLHSMNKGIFSSE
uniref:Endonuclease/exonuclease/phosphatase domain-containing protein n=1 Tax=Kalanchoe fedtschenkoi TaxID=63787 RepID=A0A7N0TYK2_KALFE